MVYVGKAPLRMESEYRSDDDMVFRYKLVDIRELDGKRLLRARGIGDNVLAILTLEGDEPEAVRQIVGRIARLDVAERRSTLVQLQILAGLWRLGRLVKEEANRMPITEHSES